MCGGDISESCGASWDGMGLCFDAKHVVLS